MLHAKKIPYIEQMQQTECGLCCIAMILRYYKSHESLGYIRSILPVGRDGLRLSDLHNYLVKRNLESHIYRITADQINTLPLPAIAYWDRKHFIVVAKITKKQITIVDPAWGHLSVSFEEFEKHYSGIIMTARPTDNFIPCTEKRAIWPEIMNGLRNKKKLFLSAILISLLTYSIQLIVPMLVQKIIDQLALSGSSLDIRICINFALALFILFGITSFSRQLIMTNYQIELDKALTQNTFHKLMSLPYSYFENRPSGDLLFRLNSLDVIRTILAEHIVSGIIQAGFSITLFIYLLHKSAYLTGIACCFFIFSGLFILIMRKQVMEANRLQMMKTTRRESIQTESIYSIFEIKSSGMEKSILEDWDDIYVQGLRAYKKKGTILNIYSTTLSLLQLVGPFVVLLFSIQQNLSGNITIGECIAYYSLSASFIGTSLSLFNLWNDFSMASVYLERILDIISEPSEEVRTQCIPIAVNGNIEFRNVSFSYNKNSEPVIRNLSFSIKKGTKFAIVGPSGSGKSTITKLLLGLYKPTEGDIYYEGINMNALDPKELRKQIGIIPQDMSLFNRTIAENIALNQKQYDMKDVINSSKIAHIHDEIMQMPMQYRTLISDLGRNLSGGQRQRIVLARALMKNPQVMILDEATSSLDNLNEAEISQYFQKCGNTQVIIAHRMSTIIDSDEILVLDQGQKVEIGTHEELIKNNGVYAQLYQNDNSTLKENHYATS